MNETKPEIRDRVLATLAKAGPCTFNALINSLEHEDGQMKLIIGDRIEQLAQTGEVVIDPNRPDDDPMAFVYLPDQKP